MNKINFEAGTQVSPAKVTIDNVDHEVTPAVWEGNTPLSPFVLNKIQDNIEEDINSTKEEIEKKIKNQRLKLVGKSEQNGTPSPNNIISIRNVGDELLQNENFRQGNAENVSTSNRLFSISNKKLKAGKTYILSTNLDISIYKYSINLNEKPYLPVATLPNIYDAGWQTEKTFTFTPEKNCYLGIPVARVDNANLTINDISNYYFKISGCGSIDYKVENADKTESKNIHFPLAEGQVLHKGDYIDSTGIHQKKKTYVFTGTENFELITISNNIAQISLTINDIIISIDKEERYIISNYFKGIKWNNSWLYDNSITVMPINKKIVILSSTYTTIGTLKTWLAEQYANGTPVTIEYKLAEEIVTPLTQEQIEAYYELQKAKYVDKMTLTCLNEIEPTIIDTDKKLEESLLDVEKLLAILNLNS